MTLTPAIAIAGVVMVALTFYVLFAGADFGGGVWDFLASGPRKKEQRDVISHALAPIWEANHVWLILVIVLLFTCFPSAFSTIAIALHIPLSLMLFASCCAARPSSSAATAPITMRRRCGGGACSRSRAS
jgi:cytochrome d ubiquinol oxidase subunit II